MLEFIFITFFTVLQYFITFS